ncbi:MAG: SRPBCC domain-containing protein [Pirellulaceae bacterium]
MSSSQLSLDLEQSIEINSAIGDAYNALVRRLTDENSTPDNRPMPMVLEQWPGGRWFRDLGPGQGHLWALVQVIKPPTLMELHGPMFMSYAVAGHMQFRLTQVAGGVELYLRHQVIGPVDDEHRQRVVPGWRYLLEQTKRLAERSS